MSSNLRWLEAGAVACLFTALALLLYRLMLAPQAEPNTLGFRGLKRAQALEAHFASDAWTWRC